MLRLTAPGFACALVVAAAQPAAAQDPVATRRSPEILRSMHLAARNQLGILQYCVAQGAVGEDVVALQRQAVGALPPAPENGLAEAEAAGRRGMVSFDGSEVAFAAAANARGLRVEANCKFIAITVLAQAGQPPRW